MKKIKNRYERTVEMVRIYPSCLVCGMKYESHMNFNAVRMMYPQFKGWEAVDIAEALRVELHHRMPDTDKNIKKYPLFIHSDRNLLPLHAKCHAENKFFMFIEDHEAQQIENELSGNPGMLEETNDKT